MQKSNFAKYVTYDGLALTPRYEIIVTEQSILPERHYNYPCHFYEQMKWASINFEIHVPSSSFDYFGFIFKSITKNLG